LSGLNLRVMTFNLLTSTKQKRRHPWRLRRRNIARIFEQWQPDVVGTQEANFRQLKELSDLLPNYDFLGEGNLGSSMAHSDSNWYCATFYRRDRIRPMDPSGGSEALWLSPTPEVPASQFHLGTRPRLVTWNNFEIIGTAQPFVFGTTHLEAVNSWHRHRSVAQIRQHVSQKMEELGDNIPLFLTGDFNAVSKSSEIKALSDQERPNEPLFDAWAEAHGGDTPEGALSVVWDFGIAWGMPCWARAVSIMCFTVPAWKSKPSSVWILKDWITEPARCHRITIRFVPISSLPLQFNPDNNKWKNFPAPSTIFLPDGK